MLTEPRLAVDYRRRQPRAFVSHAHADHMARHGWAYCTPETGRLYRHRLGGRLETTEIAYGESIELSGIHLTMVPAGHCLGSAMLLADNGERRLLYTGDFKLSESLTAQKAELPSADILIMESTFGRPRYRMPKRSLVIEQLLETVHGAFALGKTPVVHAYALGKSQEVTALLTTAGVPVLQHPDIYALSRIYEASGVSLESPSASYYEFGARASEGHAVVTLPRTAKRFRLAGLGQVVSIAVTGWSIDSATRHRLGVDHAIPLTDHADFDELLETVERVGPREVYCTHGPDEFVTHLQEAGFNAHPLAPPAQRRLFH